MKKLLLSLMVIVCAASAGCSNDDEERTAQTIFVHLKDKNGQLIELNVENTAVFFFEDNGKAINYTLSNPSLNDGKLTYTDGTMSENAKFKASGRAVYTFENLPNGSYILWVHYFPYSFGTQSSKRIVVSERSHLSVEEKIFRTGDRYEEW